MRNNKEEIVALTSIRGIAAIAVAMYHYPKMISAHNDLWLPIIFQRGYLGVDLFFVLSGFVLSLVSCYWIRSFFSVKNYIIFIMRRLGRIYPLHFFMFLVMFSTELTKYLYPYIGLAAVQYVLPFTFPNDLSSAILHIFLIHGWGFVSDIGFNGISWTISSEMFAYLIFPLLFISCNHLGGRKTIIFLFLVLLWNFFYYFYISPYGVRVPWSHILIRCLNSFIPGMFVFLAREQILSNGTGKRIELISEIISLISLTAVIVMMSSGVRDCYIVPFFPFIVLGLSIGKGGISKVLSIKVIKYLGKISYSIYMTHIFCFWLIASAMKIFGEPHGVFNQYVVFVSSIALFITMSSMTYRYVEIPGRKFVESRAQFTI